VKRMRESAIGTVGVGGKMAVKEKGGAFRWIRYTKLSLMTS